MGLFKAIGGAMGDVLSDQWREYFYCDAMEPNVLVERAYKRKGKRGKSLTIKGERRLYVICKRCGAHEVIVYRKKK